VSSVRDGAGTGFDPDEGLVLVDAGLARRAVPARFEHYAATARHDAAYAREGRPFA
jgi:hypothetical protein